MIQLEKEKTKLTTFGKNFFWSIIITGMIVASCQNEAQSVEKVGYFQVEFLFKKDGVKVYRFRDNGRDHYFTTTGETISAHTENKTTVDENISSYRDSDDERFQAMYSNFKKD